MTFWRMTFYDGRVGQLCKVFSSTSQRFLTGLRSGLCGDKSMCENDVSCSLNHSFTVWARWIAALSSPISISLRTAQLFSFNPLSSLHIVWVEMVLLSLSNTAVSSIVDFVRFDLSKSDLRSRSLKIFFWLHFFHDDDGSPLSFQGFNNALDRS